MRFIKRLGLNRKDPANNRFAVQADDRIVTTSKVSLQLPSGATSDRPATPVNGMTRYNSTLNDSEVYNISGSGAGWEKIKTNRQTTVTPQSLGLGNYVNTLFGPLSYDVSTSKPQNVLVFVDNVYQIPTTNYSLVAGTSISAVIQNTVAINNGDATITVNTTSNVLIGETITAASGFAAGTKITSVNTATRVIGISPSATGGNSIGTNLTVSFSSGTFVEFTGIVPAKQVFVLLGFDGYYPPNS
jgi:hypothetical protein